MTTNGLISERIGIKKAMLFKRDEHAFKQGETPQLVGCAVFWNKTGFSP